MAKFRLLHGTHVVSGDDLRLVTYTAGDIVQSEKDLCAIFNRESMPNGPPLQRFELIAEEQPA